MHRAVDHGAEINQQPEPVSRQEELQVHVLGFIFFAYKKPS